MAQGKTLDIWSKWVGNSQVEIRIRKITRGKLVIDLTEFSPQDTEVGRVTLNKLAINAARFFGASGPDFCVIRDYLTDRKATRGDGTVVGIHVRQKSYAFAGFPEKEWVQA
jgi:hypothetical protein